MSDDIDKQWLSVKVEANLTKPAEEISGVIVNAANFMGKVVGPVAEHGFGIIGDQFAHWRALNIERLKDKWTKRRESRDVSVDAVKLLPFDIGFRLFDAASIEGDEEVQELWAGLLDFATDPNSNLEIRRIFIDILKSVSGVDAVVLKFLWIRHLRDDVQRDSISDSEVTLFADGRLGRVPLDARRIAIQNLRRQQCVRLIPDGFYFDNISEIEDILRPRVDVEKERLITVFGAIKRILEDLSGTRDPVYLGSTNENWIPELAFDLTELGISLMQVCQGNENLEMQDSLRQQSR